MGFDFQAAYDELNPADDDYRFYAALAASAGVSRAVDLRCGTGALARMLASGGASVTGVDPDPAMLRVARSRDPGGRIDWRLGRTGEATTSRNVLAFRDELALRASLEHAVFKVGNVYGDWDQAPPSAAAPELIIIARKP